VRQDKTSKETRDIAEKTLSPREVNFCRNYAEGMTIWKAYMDAGYTPKDTKSASASGSKLLRKDNIKEEVERQQTRMDNEVLRLIKANAYNGVKCLGNLIDFSLPHIMLSASKDALDRAGHKPPEKLEHSGEVTLNILDILKAARTRNEGDDHSTD